MCVTLLAEVEQVRKLLGGVGYFAREAWDLQPGAAN